MALVADLVFNVMFEISLFLYIGAMLMSSCDQPGEDLGRRPRIGGRTTRPSGTLDGPGAPSHRSRAE